MPAFKSDDMIVMYVHSEGECDEVWFDLWDCACDSECPNCGAPIEAHGWCEIGQMWDDAIAMQQLRETI